MIGLWWLLSALSSVAAADARSAVEQRVEAAYRQAWVELDQAVSRLETELGAVSEADPSGLFARLQEAIEVLDLPGVTALLYDPGGEAIAWHGAGLLHEPDGFDLPARGRLWRRGVTAVTLMSVASLGADDSWRLVVGRSYPHEPFPFAELAQTPRWSVALPETADPGPAGRSHATEESTWRVTVENGPDLVLAEPPVAARQSWPWPWPGAEWWRHLTLGAVLLALLLGVPRQPSSGEEGRPFMLAALVLALLGAAFHDRPMVGVFCAAGALMLGAWGLASARGPSRRARAALLAALLAAGLGQTVDRVVLRHQIESYFLPRMGPPTVDELNDLLGELHASFDGRDVSTILPPGAGPLDLGDLAFALWRQSSLPQRDALSALVLETPEERSSFSFGLALSDGVVPSADPARWTMPPSTAWRDALVQGDATLFRNGRPWAAARYWYLPRPGFRLAGDETHELERNLLRGKPRHEVADGLPPDVLYGLYELDGRALISPWAEAPPLAPTALATERSVLVDTPGGRARCWARRGLDGIEALFLPILDLREALERVAFLAGFLLPALLLPALVAAWSASGGRPLTSLRNAWRSYSRRLLLVYAILLVVPLVALNLLLLRSVAERERAEQVEAAHDAMASARKLLANYLSGLEPGFILTTVVDRELLEWISGLVGHQINLYWGSQLFVSSQQELFTAGLIPRRIPGEIYDRLTYRGYDLGFRRHAGLPHRQGDTPRADDPQRVTGTTAGGGGEPMIDEADGDLAYLEIYAPFDAEGARTGQQGLFLSVPLLEQEERAERQLAALRQRALLVTSALGLVLLAVGDRWTRRFARPIVELIDGTRRIARGEPLRPLAPKDAELASLAEAIGVMADQVAESRTGLMREKHFVERVVAHITSAVVSLDDGLRVVFQNDLAERRLGTVVGQPITTALQDSTLEPLRTFLVSAHETAAGRPINRQIKKRSPSRSDDDDDGGVREWSVTWVPIARDLESTAPAALVVVDDVTEVVRGQRLEAWAEMARIIAHEIKNPLTPIQLSTEHLVRVWKVDPERMDEVVDRCADTILSNVEELRDIASEFSTYSRIPAADLQLGDLSAAVTGLAASYHAAESSRGVGIVCRADQPIHARFDAKLLGRAVRNLLENALRAAEPSAGQVDVEVTVRDGKAVIEVADSGPGVDPLKLERIFEPYFSTYETGTGLGLAITRRIVEQHGGEIEARNRAGGGLAVVIRMPIGDAQIASSESTAVP